MQKEVKALNVISRREESNYMYANVSHLTLSLYYKPRKSCSDCRVQFVES